MGRGPRPKPKRPQVPELRQTLLKAAPRWPELRQTVPAPTAARAEAERRQSCARQCAAEGDL